MAGSRRHEDIQRFMEAKKQGVPSEKDMVWDEETGTFLVVDKGTGDELPSVTAEDLQAFASRSSR